MIALSGAAHLQGKHTAGMVMPVLVVCVQTSSTLETLLQDAGVDAHALPANGVATNGVEAQQVQLWS